MIEKYLDLRYTDLYLTYEEYHDNIDTSLERRALEISGWIDDRSTVLDVGCGDGKNALLLKQKKNANVIGIDIVNKAKSIIPIINIDLNTTDLPNTNQYDYVLLCEVLEHLVRPNEILCQSIRIARKGVIVTIPNTGYWYSRLQLLAGYFPRQSFTHLHYWTLKDFHIFCQQLHLNILLVKTNQSRNPIKTLLKGLFPNLFAYQLYFFLSPTPKS